ncbi:hypothetical protein DPMN_121838 [Dreissena polymorpha]|uniref:Uncharacterized protein n=1 Tax=Dreissena polymorpha TaxID=45954 RepID=A0A9D4GR97_DREPO|nr:hypothetical protein DPMN_121838 [Dreissena polymorpha]
MLSVLEEAATWSRMRFKPRNSRALVIRKGQPTKKFNLTVQVDNISSIMDSPIKCLGKWYDMLHSKIGTISSASRTRLLKG